MADQKLPPQLQILERGGFDPDRVRLVLYGESGTGKTVFASTAPDPIFIDLDDGLGSVRTPVSRWQVNSWDDLLMSLRFLQGSNHSYRTVIIDTVNEMQSLVLRETVERFPDVRRAYNSVPGQSDYGKMLSDVDVLIREFKALPMNVIFIAQVQSQEFSTDVVLPQLIGKASARNLVRLCDEVGFMFKAEHEGGARMIAFDAVDYVTKDRSGVLPPMIEVPSTNVGWELLYQYWVNI